MKYFLSFALIFALGCSHFKIKEQYSQKPFIATENLQPVDDSIALIVNGGRDQEIRLPRKPIISNKTFSFCRSLENTSCKIVGLNKTLCKYLVGCVVLAGGLGLSLYHYKTPESDSIVSFDTTSLNLDTVFDNFNTKTDRKNNLVSGINEIETGGGDRVFVTSNNIFGYEGNIVFDTTLKVNYAAIFNKDIRSAPFGAIPVGSSCASGNLCLIHVGSFRDEQHISYGTANVIPIFLDSNKRIPKSSGWRKVNVKNNIGMLKLDNTKSAFTVNGTQTLTNDTFTAVELEDIDYKVFQKISSSDVSKGGKLSTYRVKSKTNASRTSKGILLLIVMTSATSCFLYCNYECLCGGMGCCYCGFCKCYNDMSGSSVCTFSPCYKEGYCSNYEEYASMPSSIGKFLTFTWCACSCSRSLNESCLDCCNSCGGPCRSENYEDCQKYHCRYALHMCATCFRCCCCCCGFCDTKEFLEYDKKKALEQLRFSQLVEMV